MTSYKVLFQQPAKKFIEENKKMGLKFYHAFLEIAYDKTDFLKYDVKKLQGQDNAFVIMIGQDRAFFSVYEKNIFVLGFDCK